MKRRHRTAHFAIWRGLALILPLLFAIASIIHYQQSGDSAPIQLSPPAVIQGEPQ
jgi:hypothetical protein